MITHCSLLSASCHPMTHHRLSDSSLPGESDSRHYFKSSSPAILLCAVPCPEKLHEQQTKFRSNSKQQLSLAAASNMGDGEMLIGRLHSKICDILQHVLLHVDNIRSICNLLQVSTAVRLTVQSCRAQCRISAKHAHADDDQAQLSSLQQHAAVMRWLPRHAGLVTELQLYACSEDQAMVAYTLLEQALQLCAQNASHHTQGMHTAAEAAAAAAAAAGDVGSMAASGTSSILQDAAPGPLLLHSFMADSLPPAAVLRLLHSAGLQVLYLHPVSAAEFKAVPAAFYSALGGMQGLKKLSLMFREQSMNDAFPVAFALAVGQLHHVTHLTAGTLTPAGARVLPVSLRHLVLLSPYMDSFRGSEPHCAAADGDVMSLSHLTALTCLDWANFEGKLCDVTLPQQPLKLESTGSLHLVGPHNLPHVRIHIWRDRWAWHGLLLQLPASPCTCFLEVRMTDIEGLSQESLQEVGSVLGALTKLTSLTLTARGSVSSLQHMQLVQQLRKLPSLVEVSLTFQGHGTTTTAFDGNVDACSMLQLSVLTSLTKLRVYDNVGAGLNDFAAAAVAVNLTRLQELRLTSCMMTWSAVPAIARLSGLRSLELNAQPREASYMPAVLQQLRSLTLLTHLALNLPLYKLSEAERQQFLAGMPFLRSL